MNQYLPLSLLFVHRTKEKREEKETNPQDTPKLGVSSAAVKFTAGFLFFFERFRAWSSSWSERIFCCGGGRSMRRTKVDVQTKSRGRSGTRALL